MRNKTLGSLIFGVFVIIFVRFLAEDKRLKDIAEHMSRRRMFRQKKKHSNSNTFD